MKKTRLVLCAVAMFATVCATFRGAIKDAEPAGQLLQTAIHKQVVEGDLKQAMAIYGEILSKYSENHDVAASALLHMADIHEKLGNDEARRIYERLLREYPDQRQAVTIARSRLAQSTPNIPAPHLICRDCSGNDASVSPDGLLVYSGDGLVVRDIAKGEITRWSATATGFQPKLSPDGKSVALITLNRALAILPRVSGSQRTAFNVDSDVIPVRLHTWSHDSRWLLVTARKRDVTYALAWVSVADHTLKEIVSLGTRDAGTANLSPDGRFIAYSAGSGRGARESRSYLIPSDGGPRIELVAGGPSESPVWTPDGKRMLFISPQGDSADLLSAAVRDGKPNGPLTLVMKDIGRNTVPHGITGTGTYYYTKRTSPLSRVYVTSPQEERSRRDSRPRITISFEGRQATISPNGRFIAFERGNDSRVVYSFETREEKVFGHSPSENFLTNRPAIWFHDNVGFLERRWDDDRRETISVYRIDLNGGSRKLLDGPAPLLRSDMALSPDDETLFISGTDARGILNTVSAFDLATGDHKPVIVLGNRQTIETLAVSRNGTTLALVVRSATGRMSIALVGVDGSNYRVRFTSNSDARVAALNPSIAWTNNDQEIFFMTETSFNQLSDARIMRLSVAGDDKPEWTRLDGDGLRNSDPLRRMLSLSDDGSRIVYSSRTAQTLELWSLDLSSMLKAQSVASK